MNTTPPLDPKAPLVADARTMSRAPGTVKEWSADIDVTEKLGLDMIAIPEGSRLSVRLTLTSVSEGVLVNGTISAPVTGECSRCLEAIDDVVEVEASELYAYEDSATAETTDADEVMRVQADLLDLEPLVRDALVFSMSTTPLCGPDCAGLCADCGERLDDLPADHGHEVIDPRWAALQNFVK